MVFLAMSLIDISEEAKVLTVITTILSRDSRKRPSSSDDIKQKEGGSERLWETRIRHKLEVKLVVRGEMIRCERSMQALLSVGSCSGHKDRVAQLVLA